MTFSEAKQFLSATEIEGSQPSRWADFGCGSGLFTKVLSARLCNGSRIYAVDKAMRFANTSANKEVTIVLQQADFVTDELNLSGLHGIMMANSLHYVADKRGWLQKIQAHLLPTTVFIIIEYDNASANRWVPYPASFSELKNLFSEAGYLNIHQTGERKSLYQSGKMYSCLIKP